MADSTGNISVTSSIVNMSSIPLSLLLILSIFAAFGIVYALSLLFFNVVNQKKKVIKMTSPNVNVVILIGCCIGYCDMILLGFSSPTFQEETITQALQASTFLLSISFTLIFGSVFSKVVRIHMIFTNLSLNGKAARDEHLLLSVTILLILDLVILLSWHFIDPVICHTCTWKTDGNPNVTYVAVECSSELQVLWICLIYIYKAAILSVGLYFTWQTRFVTLPSIKDSQLIPCSVYTVAILALTVLPLLLVNSESVVIKYSVGAVAIWISLTVTVTVLFIPKVILLRQQMKENDANKSDSTTRLQFSESMTKTKQATSECNKIFFFCCKSNNNEDKYAQEILATEIETLKRTINEKDLTIRELTDRLYIGAEKFHQYLTNNKTRQQSVNRTNNDPHLRESRRHHPTKVRPGPAAAAAAVTATEASASAPAGPPAVALSRRDDLRDYRLSRFYAESYDSRTETDSSSCSCSCSSCNASDIAIDSENIGQLQRMAVAGPAPKRSMEGDRKLRGNPAHDDGGPASTAPQELSVANLTFRYQELDKYDRNARGFEPTLFNVLQTKAQKSKSQQTSYYHREESQQLPSHQHQHQESPHFQAKSIYHAIVHSIPSAIQDDNNYSPSSTERGRTAAAAYNHTRAKNKLTRTSGIDKFHNSLNRRNDDQLNKSHENRDLTLDIDAIQSDTDAIESISCRINVPTANSYRPNHQQLASSLSARALTPPAAPTGSQIISPSTLRGFKGGDNLASVSCGLNGVNSIRTNGFMSVTQI